MSAGSRRSIPPGCALVARCLTFAVLTAALAGPAHAEDLTSASYRLRGLHPSALGPAVLDSSAPNPKIGGSGASLGQGEAIGLAGSLANLTTSASGFWALLAAGLPSLDADSDSIPAFLDDDDDNDGLLDVVETNTGVFVSGLDTGSDPLDSDTDDDGVNDGDEVTAGTDPNVPNVPALPVAGVVLLAFAIALEARRSQRKFR